MAALTAPRSVARYGVNTGYPERLPGVGMAASTIIYAGAPICVNASGYAVNASAATGLITAGLAQENFENTATPDTWAQPGFIGTGANNGLYCEPEPGVYPFNAGASGTPTMANYGADLYWVDNQTVTTTSSGSSIAGIMVGIDPNTGLILVLLGVNFK